MKTTITHCKTVLNDEVCDRCDSKKRITLVYCARMRAREERGYSFFTLLETLFGAFMFIVYLWLYISLTFSDNTIEQQLVL